MKEKERSKRMERVKKCKKGNNRGGGEGKGYRYITTGKGERKLKRKGKEM